MPHGASCRPHSGHVNAPDNSRRSTTTGSGPTLSNRPPPGAFERPFPAAGQREREGPLAFKIARNLSGCGPHPDATHQPDRRAPKTSSPPKTRRTLSPSAGATLNTRPVRRPSPIVAMTSRSRCRRCRRSGWCPGPGRRGLAVERVGPRRGRAWRARVSRTEPHPRGAALVCRVAPGRAGVRTPRPRRGTGIGQEALLPSVAPGRSPPWLLLQWSCPISGEDPTRAYAPALTTRVHSGVIVDQWDALVAELATTPDVVDRLLAEHVPDDSRRCRACTRPGLGTPMKPWPCGLYKLAMAAKRRGPLYPNR